MNRWEALYRLIDSAISQPDRTPRLIAIIAAVVIAIIVLLSTVSLLAGPHAHTELVHALWRIIHTLGQYPSLP